MRSFCAMSVDGMKLGGSSVAATSAAARESGRLRRAVSDTLATGRPAGRASARRVSGTTARPGPRCPVAVPRDARSSITRATVVERHLADAADVCAPGRSRLPRRPAEGSDAIRRTTPHALECRLLLSLFKRYLRAGLAPPIRRGAPAPCRRAPGTGPSHPALRSMGRTDRKDTLDV
jgi:hypothetical protein